MAVRENTGNLRDDGLPVGRPFQKGNPGRPKGARNKLQENFLADMLEAWNERGVAAINAMIDEKPGDFVKVVASILPREATLNINDHSEMTDDELAERVRNLATQLAPFLADGIGGTTEGTAGEAGAQVTPRVH